MTLSMGSSTPAIFDRSWAGEFAYFTKIRCGARDCSARVAEVQSRRAKLHSHHICGLSCDRNGFDDYHVVRFITGFGYESDGVLSLTPRVRKQWEKAKRERTRWDDFLGRDRRLNGRDSDRSFLAREIMIEGGELIRFRCPVCRRLNHTHVPHVCSFDCACRATGDAPALAERYARWHNRIN